MPTPIFIFIIFFGCILLIQIFIFIRRFKRANPDKILLIYGRISTDPKVKFLLRTSGTTFVWPVIQKYTYLDAGPKYFEISGSASSRDSISKNYIVNLIAKISSDESQVHKAADLFFLKKTAEVEQVIKSKLEEVIHSEIAGRSDRELKEDYGKFRTELKKGMTAGLETIGVELVAVKNMGLVN